MFGKSFTYHITKIDRSESHIHNALTSKNPIQQGDIISIPNSILPERFRKDGHMSVKFIVDRVIHVMSENGAKIKHSVIYLSSGS